MAPATTWPELSGAALARDIARIRRALERRRDGRGITSERAAAGHQGEPAAIDFLARRFGLSAFERDVVVLCAAAALDDEVALLCAAAHGDERAYPTFGLALAALAEPHWSALVPDAPLRRWRLVELAPGFGPVAAPLEIDERILHHLRGVDYLDARLAGLMEPVTAAGPLPASRTALARRIGERLVGASGADPLVLLTGADRTARRAVTAAACSDEGRELYVLAAGALPEGAADRGALCRVCERETALSQCAFLIEWDAPAGGHPAVEFAARLRAPTVVSSDESVIPPGRGALRLELSAVAKEEQRRLWELALEPQGLALNGQLERVVEQFDFEPADIRVAAQQLTGQDGEGEAADRLWAACRAQACPRLDDLAQRIEPMADWDDLVLPQGQCDVLRQVSAHVRNRATVYERWGFAAKSARGLGIAALLSGPSGTGKTMAAEVLARDLCLDLYRIDLSSVVSKYIGETEKNLRRVFGAAEGTGAVLLFDEADALFGSRSEVRDSHDRFANIEVSYLLQRIDSYRGLALLTTNLRNAIDPAFLRRLRFVVEFPFPDLEARAAIWRRVFPAAAPLDGVDLDRFARLDLAGGNIRNIALGAAFLAADAGQPVATEHLERAMRDEYAKVERPLPDLEAVAWS